MSSGPHTHDLVAYPSFPYPDTHPDRLAVMGILHGLNPTPVERCRVLEVGCNEGANLIPMAYAIPGSEFVGFDIAELPVLRAQARIKELGLSNVQVFQADLLTVGETLGMFDYIIAHGVYSWVSDPVRDALLSLCHQHLTPTGIAFISYNALPGGHLRNMMREILLNRCDGVNDPVSAVNQGIDFLRSVVELRGPGDPLSALMEKEAGRLQLRNIREIYHDELSSEHRPVLFSNFIAHAGKNDLSYLSESVIMPPGDPSNQPKAVAMANHLAEGDPIAKEQILDFVRMRGYRETLLCHANLTPSLEIRMDVIQRLNLSSQAVSSPGDSEGSRTYTLPDGLEMKATDTTSITVMEYLISSWPEAVPFTELEEVLAQQGIQSDPDFRTLLLRMASARMVQFHIWNAPVSKTIPARPRASASGRQEAVAHGFITTLHHLPLALGDTMVRRFLSILDGSRDRTDLLKVLHREFPDISEANLTGGIEMSLNVLHRAGMLLVEDFQ
jgi:SAM-dependent methyltransferase